MTATPPTALDGSFQNLQMFWSDDMYICFWYIPEIQMAAQIVNVQSWVRCGPNSLYSCRGIFCKLCRHFLQLLKMCMLFGRKPRITFCHFLQVVNLVIFLPH